MTSNEFNLTVKKRDGEKKEKIEIDEKMETNSAKNVQT
jgi:hypothetical protein